MAKVKEQQLRMNLAEEEEEEEEHAQPKAEIVDAYEHRVRAHTEKVVEILRSSGLIRSESE